MCPALAVKVRMDRRAQQPAPLGLAKAPRLGRRRSLGRCRLFKLREHERRKGKELGR